MQIEGQHYPPSPLSLHGGGCHSAGLLHVWLVGTKRAEACGFGGYFACLILDLLFAWRFGHAGFRTIAVVVPSAGHDCCAVW